MPVVSPGFELAASFSVFSPVRSELSIVLELLRSAAPGTLLLVTTTSAGNVPLLPLNHFFGQALLCVCIICNSSTHILSAYEIIYYLYFVKLPLLGISAPCDFCICCSVVIVFIWKFDSSCSNSNKGKRKTKQKNVDISKNWERSYI